MAKRILVLDSSHLVAQQCRMSASKTMLNCLVVFGLFSFVNLIFNFSSSFHWPSLYRNSEPNATSQNQRQSERYLQTGGMGSQGNDKENMAVLSPDVFSVTNVKPFCFLHCSPH